MSRIVDHRRKRYGKLVVRDYAGRSAAGNHQWICDCDCGGVKIVESACLGRQVNSCGCLKRERIKTLNYKHGMCRSPEYGVWAGMLRRCNEIGHVSYKHYGAKGISVCDRWQLFENFFADLGNRPSKSHQLERRDPSGNYCPENCYWTTKRANQLNKSNNRLLEIGGKTMTVTEWAEISGIKAGTIFSRLQNGWPARDAVFKPLRPLVSDLVRG